MHLRARIYVAGGTTLVGRTLLDHLQKVGYSNLVGVPPHEPELTDSAQVQQFFARELPEYVFLVAGASGGIRSNQRRPADLMLDNLLTSTNVLQQAHAHRAIRLLYLASSCSYPREAPQPLCVEALLTGPLEPTNEAYALAKLAGWKLCEAFRRQYGVNWITAIPANPFGTGDDFSPENGHVIPALLRRMHQAKIRNETSVTIWGTGQPRREFIYARDLADACLFAMRHYSDEQPINLGSQSEWTIADTARVIAKVVGYKGRLVFDTSQPDGMPRKVLDSSKLFNLGWRPTTDFRTALEETYAWFLAHELKQRSKHVRATV